MVDRRIDLQKLQESSVINGFPWRKSKFSMTKNKKEMENKIKSELMYRLSDYIGTFTTLDALHPGMILPGHVQSFLENRLIEVIDYAKCQYVSDGKTDKNLYGLIVGAEAAIKSANETIKADGKGYCYSLA